MTDATTDLTAQGARDARPVDRPARRSWRKFRRHRSAIAGAVLVGVFLIAAILAPVLPLPAPEATDWGAVRQAPSAAHWMGTDEIGRDLLSRLVWGARASLLAGVVSVGLAMALGVPLGLVAGYFGGCATPSSRARPRRCWRCRFLSWPSRLRRCWDQA